MVHRFIFFFLCVFSEKPPPPPVVYSRFTDDTLRDLIKRLRERTEMLKEKVIDPYATSPEITPPVSKYRHTVQTAQRQKTTTTLTHCHSLHLLSTYSEEGGLHQTEGGGADSKRRSREEEGRGGS